MNIEPLLNVIKNHELIIMEPNQIRELLGVKRLGNNTISELTKELNTLGYVIIPIRYNSSRNGLTDVRKVIIIKKDTYIRIVKEKDTYAMARAVIDYVLSNKQLFVMNVKNHNGILKIQASVIKKLLKYIGLDSHYLDTHMNSLILTTRAVLEAMGFPTKFRRAKSRTGSIIYVYEGGSRVTAGTERLLNPPAESRAGDGHVGNPTWSNPRSNPNKIREDKEEGPNNQEQQDTGTRRNGAVGVTAGVCGNTSREGGGSGYVKVQNHKGGRTRTNEKV